MAIDLKTVAAKWQARWNAAKINKTSDKSTKPKFYNLEMFPYPSAYGLHMGHVRNYAIGDTIARYKRMTGYHVLYPMGFDAFGLPAENAAIKNKIHPRKYTEDAIASIKASMQRIGLSYDWDRTLATCYPDYYKWNQYFFLKFYEKGLAYRKKAPINWCPSCTTVLANEQVEDGKCWRCSSVVEVKDLEQWFFKITAYADELLKDLDNVHWPERIKAMQKNWIGRSAGTLIQWNVQGTSQKLEVFTTRADTIYGVSCIIIAPEHPVVQDLVKGTKHQEEVQQLINKVVLQEKFSRAAENKEKEGVFTGRYAIHPLTGKEIPIYIANFVLMDYGTGMIMAVPAHDVRDHEFATKYHLPIHHVVAPLVIGEKPRPGKNEVIRDTVVCVLRDPKKNLFAALSWKKFDWRTFVIGGIEKNEDPIAAGYREIQEETGYKNIKFVRVLGEKFVSKYYAAHKDENRTAITTGLLFDLENSEKNPLSNAEEQTHEVQWIPGNKIIEFLNFESQKILAERTLKEMPSVFTDEGILLESGKFTGLHSEKARHEITHELDKLKIGKAVTNYKLRDWLLSRQRYWGTPIPIVYCNSCGAVPVPEKQLPITLPENVEFTGKGNPLANTPSFVNCKCPQCKKPARRETDTMDTFVDSSWYYLRYPSAKEKKVPFKRDVVDRWMPVDQYIGGAEHAVMHLLYARFFTKVLRDLGFVGINEPFTNLFNQGIVYKDGQRMSKSKGNVVSQEEVEQSFGIDTARLFLLFVASPGKDIEWSHEGAQGCLRFLNRVGVVYDKPRSDKKDPVVESKLHVTIKAVTNSLTDFELNKGIIALMDFVNLLEKRPTVSVKVLEILATLLAPFVPHVAEECWEQTGKKSFVCKAKWPTHDEKKIKPEFDFYDAVATQFVTDTQELIKLMKIQTPKLVTVIVADQWKYDFFHLVKEKLKTTRNPGEIIKTILAGPLKSRGDVVGKMVPTLVNNPAKLPQYVLDQKKELAIFSDAAEGLSKQLNCPVKLVFEQNSTHQKAKNAWPGKPALVIE